MLLHQQHAWQCPGLSRGDRSSRGTPGYLLTPATGWAWDCMGCTGPQGVQGLHGAAGAAAGHLLADRPLLALMERPGSGRDLVMEGILTEPLNTVRLS